MFDVILKQNLAQKCFNVFTRMISKLLSQHQKKKLFAKCNLPKSLPEEFTAGFWPE